MITQTQIDIQKQKDYLEEAHDIMETLARANVSILNRQTYKLLEKLAHSVHRHPLKIGRLGARAF